MPFDTATLTKARESGYSDEEVGSFLSKSDPRVQTALQSGYSLDEIASHFDARKPEGSQPVSDIGRQFVSSIAKSTIDPLVMVSRIGSKLPAGKLSEQVSNVTGAPSSEEIIMELEGASARTSDDYGVNPKFQNTFASQVARGFGQAVPTVASGGAAPIVSALMAGEQGFQEATSYGATGAKLIAATGINATTALVTEKLMGIPRIFKLIKNTKPVASSVLKTALKTAGFEGSQEVLEQIMQDWTAQKLYDPNRRIFDWKKLATVFGVGAFVGSGVGATLQTASNLSTPTSTGATDPKTIAPKAEMQDVAMAVDESLAKMATEEPPAETPAPAETQVTETPAAQPAPTEPIPAGPRIVSTGIQTPEGVATGEGWNTKHADIIKSSETVKMALAEGMSIDELDANKGFIVEENGKQRFVGRKEALEIARKSGQVDESMLYDAEKQGLISEALKEPQNAEAIRSNEGQISPGGDVVRPSSEQGGGNLRSAYREAANATLGTESTEKVKSATAILPLTESGQFQTSSDGINAAREFLGNFPSGKSLGKQTEALRTGYGIHLVVSGVRSALHDPQVFKSVIKSVPIDVMHNLVGKKVPAEVLRNNPNMLLDKLSVPTNKLISPFVFRFLDAAGPLLTGKGTGTGTEAASPSVLSQSSAKKVPAETASEVKVSSQARATTVATQQSQQQTPRPPDETYPKVSPEEAAVALQQYREQAIDAARKAGATDPEQAASIAQQQTAEKGNTDPALFIETARRRGLDQQRQATPTGEEATGPSVERGPRAQAVSEEDARSLDEAVNSLPEVQRNIIRALEEEPDLTDRQVGEKLGLTVDQVKKAKVQYRKTMLEFVRSQGIGARLGPGAANVEEALAQYELRRFGQRFQETEEIAPEIRERTGDRYYEPIPNRVTAEKATELIETRGEEDIEREIRDEKSSLSFADRATVGQILIKKFNERFQNLADKTSSEATAILDRASELAEWAADFGTRLGQGVQSFAMWMRLTAQGKLRAYQKVVKARQGDYTRNNRNDIDEIKDILNGATKESATKASGIQKVKAKVATAKRGTGADKPIWDQYKEDLSKRMASLLPSEVTIKERGPLEKFTNQVFQLFMRKVSEPSGPQTKPPNIVRVRQMISEWSKLKEAWREAWTKLRDTDVVEHRAYIDKVSNYLDAPFTEGDIRSVMREMPIFSPSRLGQLSESSGRTAAKELADVLLDENPNSTKEMRSKIEGYAQKIIESERSKYQEAKANAEAAKKEKGKPQSKSLDRDVWVQYQQQAIKNLETALVSGKPNEQAALQEFTNRLVSALKGRIPAKIIEPKTAQEKKSEDIRVIREAMTNRDKYEEVWTNTTNALKLKYGDKPDILAKIDEVFAGGLKNPLNPKTLQSLIRERIKSDEIKLSELVRKHYSKAEEKGKSLADKISEEIGLDEVGSREVANAIESEFAAEVTKTKARALASLVKTNPIAKKISKTDAQKLIEASNLGALTDRTFYDSVSESLGLPEYTPAVAAEITRLATKVDQTQEGMPKMEAMLELNKYLAKQKGYNPSDLLWGYYYGNILSGTGTQLVNFLDTGLNILNEGITLAIQNPRAAAKVFGGLARGAALGRADAWMAIMKGRRIADGKFVEDPFFMEVSEFGKKGGVPLKADTALRRAIKTAAESPIAYPLNAWKYVGRIMSASDALMFRAAQEMKAAVLADQMANGVTTGDQILGYDRLAEFKTQAESEGYRGQQAEARATELMLMSRPAEIQKASTDFASEGTYNIKPYGLIGTVSNSVESLSRKVPPLKLIVPFTRIVGNVLNRNLNNTPFGYYRAFRGKAGTSLDPKTLKQYTPEERNALLIRASVSTALLSAAGALHALGYIEINGGGPADPEKKKQLRATGWKPYTVKVGEHYWNYSSTPIALGLAILGNWLDNSKYNDFSSKDMTDKTAYALQAISGSLLNQSFLTNLGTFWDALSSKNPGEQFSALKRLSASSAAAMGVPMTSLVKDLEGWMSDPNVPKANTLKEALISQIPFASQSLKPQLNAFGHPVKSDRSRFETKLTKDPAWRVVIEKGLRVPVPNNFFDDPDVQYEYVREQGNDLEKWVLANESRLRNQDTENAQDMLENASDAIRKRIRNKYLRKGSRKKEKSK